MKKSLKLLFILGVSSMIIGCKVSCPEFQENHLAWIPYEDGDVIELQSQSNDSVMIFLIHNVYVEHKTHYRKMEKCGTCDDFILINNSNDSDFQAHIYLHENKITNQSYIIKENYFNEYTSTYSELTNFEFENEIYEKVKIFEKNDSQGAFKKLILAKDFGIIGLIDVDGAIWSLKNGEKRLKQTKITINNTSC